METGIFKLTEEAAPALLHFEDGQTQQVLLVRLENPEGTGEKSRTSVDGSLWQRKPGASAPAFLAFVPDKLLCDPVAGSIRTPFAASLLR